jgi:hypothetical protein
MLAFVLDCVDVGCGSPPLKRRTELHKWTCRIHAE